MPVLRPEVHKVMEEALRTSRGQENEKDIKDILSDEGLSLSDVIKSLKETRDFSESEHTKTRINESFLKMHGAMKEEGTSIPVINIVIADKDSGVSDKTTILLPRELHKLKEKETIQ